MIEVEFHDQDSEQHVAEHVMDAMHVGDTIRYATSDGEQHQLPAGRITTAISDTEFQVGIKTLGTDKQKKVLGVKGARLKPDQQTVYFYGDGWVDAKPADIVRVRSVTA